MHHNFSPPQGDKSTLPVLALESGGRERYNALHPRDEQEPCAMTEREKLLSGQVYNSRDENRSRCAARYVGNVGNVEFAVQQNDIICGNKFLSVQ
ncbi:MULTISPECIES: hypothetical protein [Serratia]|uniref:hypothetical protein n=1 Tax=Serratia TaxID=613 RepID=UPI0013DAFE6F|nr:hypothetical protein [Serratia marcescens]MDX7490034.1 hypothetical protein [Serratia marcescens]